MSHLMVFFLFFILQAQNYHSSSCLLLLVHCQGTPNLIKQGLKQKPNVVIFLENRDVEGRTSISHCNLRYASQLRGRTSPVLFALWNIIPSVTHIRVKQHHCFLGNNSLQLQGHHNWFNWQQMQPAQLAVISVRLPLCPSVTHLWLQHYSWCSLTKYIKTSNLTYSMGFNHTLTFCYKLVNEVWCNYCVAGFIQWGVWSLHSVLCVTFSSSVSVSQLACHIALIAEAVTVMSPLTLCHSHSSLLSSGLCLNP